MVAWWWLIIVAVTSSWGGMFLTFFILIRFAEMSAWQEFEERLQREGFERSDSIG